MRFHDSTLVVAPTDIANHLACRHLTQLDRARLAGERIELRQDPRIDALRHRGETHSVGSGSWRGWWNGTRRERVLLPEPRLRVFL